ncbi:hypothetical protein P872_11505 [Rhodonellum psychrophilum GCM71 = DSM 17998]|uniref:Glycosyl transferase family 1 domain-containing protein n=2 Tax=Rhodonellum TaxID=336827 RepID=U5BWN4_9BACT|nr:MULTISPECIES: glycosyltransferase [Rhodonellum]ERM81021.1 hypothetical protein P872_11505 [Rhodonellum psychrophilum GCM71 = DSM 17998]SDZ41545.1 Glycosyltransferase involved in cell wall bisynthesis [Rhodonellum ikkaensis]
MKKLLFVNKEQFGYHIDTYKYIQYLNCNYKCTYICWDEGLNKIILDNVKVIYLQKKGIKVFRFFYLISAITREIRKGNYNLIFIVYFFGCSCIRFLNPKQRINLDIRTVAVSKKLMLNTFYDFLLKTEVFFFKYRSVVSYETGIELMNSDFHVIPLGGECFSKKDQFENALKLIYVGTLSGRNIIEFLIGFHNFFKEIQGLDHIKPIKLTIIGSGYLNELAELREYISLNNLTLIVDIPGYVQNDKLFEYFENSNVGISYIPLTPYYQNQPPTKTYEYLLSGFPVIATSTNANSKIINTDNGILIKDNPEDVKNALHLMYDKISIFNPLEIKNKSKSFSWKNVVENKVVPYFDQILKA